MLKHGSPVQRSTSKAFCAATMIWRRIDRTGQLRRDPNYLISAQAGPIGMRSSWRTRLQIIDNRACQVRPLCPIILR